MNWDIKTEDKTFSQLIDHLLSRLTDEALEEEFKKRKLKAS